MNIYIYFYVHVAIGVTLWLQALWWSVNIFHAYFLFRCKNGPKYVCQLLYPGPCLQRLPLELIYIGVFTVFLMVQFEMRVLGGEKGMVVTQTHHAIMTSTFAIHSLLNMLPHMGLPLPDDIDFASTVFLYSSTALQLGHHLDGKEPLDRHLHTILVLQYVVIALVTLLEAQHRHSVVLSLGRTLAALIIATWFVHIGFALYSPSPELRAGPDLNWNMAIADVVLYLHVYGNIVVLFTVGAISLQCMKRRNLIIIYDGCWHANTNKCTSTGHVKHSGSNPTA